MRRFFLILCLCGASGLVMNFLPAIQAEELPPGSVMEKPQADDTLSKSLDASEMSVFGRKYPDLARESRLVRLEEVLGSVPPPKASLEYRMSRILEIQQSGLTPERKTRAIRLYNQGVDETAKGNVEAATTIYRDAIAANPYLIPAYNNLANLQESRQQYAEAADTYQQALALSPNEPLLHFNLAVVLEKQKKIVDAYKHYRQYVELSPQPSPHIVELVRNFDAMRTSGKKTPDYYRLAIRESRGEPLIWRRDQIPVPVYIHLTEGSQAIFLDSIREGFVHWTRATRGNLRFREVGDPDKARIIITMSPAPMQDPESNTGEAHYNYEALESEDPMSLLKVDIVLNTGAPRTPLPLAERKTYVARMALHELGHAIGIWGHSADPDDIMYTHPIVSQPSDRDINTICRLYGLR